MAAALLRAALLALAVAGTLLALLGGDAKAAAAAIAPAVVPGAASPVAATSATVAGTVDPNGSATSWHVEFGPTTSYGSVTTASSAGAGDTPVDVSALLSGLTPGTLYHWRIVATSSAGTTNGADATFTTLAPPAVVTGGTLAGTTTTSRSAGSGSGAIDVSAPLTGLTPGRTYHYRLVVSSDAGTTAAREATVRVGAAPAVLTGAPAAVTIGGAAVTGVVTPNGLATQWWVEYGTTTAYGAQTDPVSVSGASQQVRAAVSGRPEGSIVHYRLVARNAAGIARGADRAFLVPKLPRTPSGAVVHCTIVGTPGNDVIRGTSHKDVICALGGDDVIYGYGGSDVIYAGDGNDRIVAGDGNDVVFAGPGDDRIDGGYGDDSIDTGPGNDTVLAGPGRDTIRTGGGATAVNGGPGADCAVVRGRLTALISAGVCPKRK